MKNGWRGVGVTVLALVAFAAWVSWANQDRLFRIRPIRERLLDTLPLAGSASFRDEALGPTGALCGEVSGVTGGQVIGNGPGGNASIMPIDSRRWRRFIVVPSVPAFYVEGLAPWAESLDGKKIATDVVDMAQQRADLAAQYRAAAAIDGIDAARTDQELTVKTREDHFETTWAQYCAAPAPAPA